uniref:Tail fiber protein n=1 Tax=Serratia phage Kevin TaxID=3161161 RepID=A0AAU8KWL4_9CAUD
MRRVEDIFGSFQIAPRQTPWTYIAQGGEQRITVPFSFVSCLLSIDGAVQIPGRAYDIDGQDIVFSDDTIEKHLNPNQQLYFLFDTAWGDIGSGGGGGNGNNGVMVERKFTTTGGETILDPKIKFSSVLLFVDGEAKYPGEYFNVVDNKLVYTTAMTAGRDVYALFGIPSSSMAGYATVESQTEAIGGVYTALAAADGRKYIGRVASVAALRTLEPTAANQVVDLVSYYATGATGGGQLYYDKDDSTSVDNGFSVFVTAGGKRWKRNLDRGIDAFMAGYNPTTNNMAACLNTIITDIVKRIVAAKTLNGIQTTINVSPNPLGGAYVMSETVKIPTCITLLHLGTVSYDFGAQDIIGFDINNTFEGLTNGLFTGYPFQTGGNRILTSTSGKIIIRGSGQTTANQAGIQWGNTAAGYMNCRDGVIDSCLVYGFIAGLRVRSRDTYIMSAEHCHFTDNRHSLLADDTTATNSGEKTTLYKCILSNSSSHGIYVNASAMDFDLVSCHLDYNKGSVLAYGASGAYGDITFSGGHVEGIEGSIVSQAAQISGAGPNRVVFDNVKFDTRTATGNTLWKNRSLRQLFSANSPVYVTLSNCNLAFEHTNVTAYGTLISHVDGNTMSRARVVVRPGSFNGYQFLPSYRDALNDYAFNGTAGSDITSSKDNATNISVIASAGATVKYGAADSDGLIPLVITMASASDTVSLVYERKLYLPYDKTLFGMISISPKSSSGNITVSSGMRSYGPQTANTTTGVLNENLLGSSADTSININDYFTNGGVDLGEYISTAPMSSKAYGRLADYIKPFVRLTGFTGSIQVKLPAWWLSF